ncbi:MAG TPA: putative sugar nucleotidyl transferase [Spirochaetota bacterium]|nr:putative sugar nucleotidyl transferase [Spirochaetota bacterium]HQF08195.1 putative sugar nucleotidyl transferase [Spirochaetota bacterium]HQH97190.1 putative sugar nucleotidyl transferase [Spirochaetota bacterium]HQJ70100.1 putative sugar nucleotidyl transferase [Spirochaetota bacterium]
MNIIIFEDGLHDNFYPLSVTKPLWELRSGLFSFRERIEIFVRRDPGLAGAGLYFFTRDYLVPRFRELYPQVHINDFSIFDHDGEFLFVNAVKYPSRTDFAIDKNSAVILGPVPVLARVDAGMIMKPFDSIPTMLMKLGLAKVDYYEQYEGPGTGRKANFIWDLMDANPDIIRGDYGLAGYAGNGAARNDVTISGDETQVYIEDGVVFDPYVFIDATGGPVVVGSGTKINSFSRIEGPCVIGRDSLILGAKVRGGTSIGTCCRIGGEIERSIFHGYCNKYHDGFIGHSYIGEWINMGALTTNSDLKNNYTNVKVYTPGSRKKTGLRKVGCFMGDFVKTSIGTLINTGTSIGPGAMLVHAGMLTPFHIPPFTWYMNGETVRTAGLDDFISTCREAMNRRNVPVTEEFIAMIRTIHAMSTPEREQQ